MGKYNLEKVNDEWKTFNEWIEKNKPSIIN